MKEITSIESLVKSARGEVVELPPFAEGTEFVARLKRPSLMRLVASNKIPNSLLTVASDLFMEQGTGLDLDDENLLKNILGVTEVIADIAFVEPTYEEIKEHGIELTDEQLMAVFNYTQQGVKALEPFRKEQKDRECSEHIS